MKLWHKIFFSTLILVMLSGYFISINMILRNHTIQMETVRNSAISLSSSISKDITEAVNEYSNGYFLSTEIMDLIISNTCKDASADGRTVECQRLKEKSYDSKNKLVTYLENSQEIQVKKNVFVSGMVYQITVKYSISSLLEQFHADIQAAQSSISIIAVAIATILLILTLLITRPIKELGIATEKIAGGDYQYRIDYRGHDELSVLAQQMNQMAAKIEQYTSYIENISESRKRFIDNMTHELKTPLTSILGFADILKIKPDISDEERREYADVILTEANRLKILSTRLMELVVTNGTNLSKARIDLGKLIEKSTGVYQPMCNDDKISLKASTETIVIQADQALLSTLILNLIDNARKASSAGDKILVSCKQCGTWAVINITDHGTGIPKEELPNITDAFYMVDKARTRKNGGAGIGLSLCQAIVNAHGGQLKIESELGKGTSVTVFLPIYEDIMK